MNRANLLRARVRSGVQTAGYLSVLTALLVLSGYLMLGDLGVLLMLTLTLVTLVLSNRLPVGVLMRMRGARPLYAGEADRLLDLNSRLAPGVYKITMTANGKPYTTTITVRPDPMGPTMGPGASGLLAIDADSMNPEMNDPINWPVVPVKKSGGR